MKENDGKKVQYSNIYLTPYYTTVDVQNPFEIILDNDGNNIKYYTYDEYEPKIFSQLDSQFIKLSSLLLLLILFLN